jgi:arsenite oxidase small subunit
MDRRSFIETCTSTAACAAAASALPAFAADAKPKLYGRVLLVDERGDPLRASRLKP